MQLFSEVEGEESKTDMYTFRPSNLELESCTTFTVKKKKAKINNRLESSQSLIYSPMGPEVIYDL